MEERKTRGWADEAHRSGDRDTASADQLADVPEDLRDTYANAGPGTGNAFATPIELPEPPAGPYPLPDVVERPAAARDPRSMPQATADPSLSRAVDRAAAGLDPEAAGYDRAAEGPPPGPLDPSADASDADTGGEPAGQWGSSGSSPA